MADASPLSATPPRPTRPPSASSFRELRDALRASPHVARLAHDGEAATAGVLVLALGAGLCLGLVLPADIEGELLRQKKERGAADPRAVAPSPAPAHGGRGVVWPNQDRLEGK